MNKVIQNYVLLQKIGQGQYGNVYKSQNKKTKQLYAVKVMNVQKFKNTPKLSQFTNNQITILSKINHPNIIKFIQMLRTTNNYYLVYQFCNGGTLAEYIKSKKRLSQQQSLKIFTQIRSAFQILSNQNILHRDLKPTNILFHNGIIKVADFGFCKQLLKQTDMTQTMVGSPIYMAPQVLKGLIYDSRADIWSMGVILYEMLYGICPYQQSSIPKLVSLIDNNILKFPSHIKISQNIKQLIEKMLTIKYRDRIAPQQLIRYRLKQQTIKQIKLNKQKQLQQQNKSTFRQVSKFIRKNMTYLSETVQLLTTKIQSLLFLRLCYMTYKILFGLMSSTNAGTSYWQFLKLKVQQQKWQYMYQNQSNALKPFAEQLKEALLNFDSSVDTKYELETVYIASKYYIDLVEKVEDVEIRERLYNCLLINNHFHNVLERKQPDFTDFVNIKTLKSLDEKRQLCKRTAKFY